MKGWHLLLIFVLAGGMLPGCNKKSTEGTSADLPGWELIWQDEFNYQGLPDSTRWSYDVGGHGWGNDELQYYTERRLENARVEDGVLIIEARRDFWQGHEYTSARLVTRGRADWVYGRFEIKAKLPAGRGTWPAIWMLPTRNIYGNGSWPDNGEIDIMEHVGYDPGKIYGTIHCHNYNHNLGTQKGGSITFSDVSVHFHVYALEWSPEKLDFYVDDKHYFTFENENKGWQSWPFNQKFYLILNLAVGGNWGGAKGVDPQIFPQQLVVDYVRVYRAGS